MESVGGEAGVEFIKPGVGNGNVGFPKDNAVSFHNLNAIKVYNE